MISWGGIKKYHHPKHQIALLPPPLRTITSSQQNRRHPRGAHRLTLLTPHGRSDKHDHAREPLDLTPPEFPVTLKVLDFLAAALRGIGIRYSLNEPFAPSTQSVYALTSFLYVAHTFHDICPVLPPARPVCLSLNLAITWCPCAHLPTHPPLVTLCVVLPVPARRGPDANNSAFFRDCSRLPFSRHD
jgi:hypothetical protein